MQDKALYLLGQLRLKQQKTAHQADIYIEQPYRNSDYKVFFFEYELRKTEQQWECQFRGINQEIWGSQADYKKLAYRSGSSRGGDVTFTTKFSFPTKKDEISDPEKIADNVNKKFDAIERFFIKILEYARKQSDKYPEAKYFDLIKQCFRSQREKLLQQFIDQVIDWPDKEKKSSKILFSLKVYINGEEKYLYDFDLIKDYLLSFSLEDKYHKSSLGTSLAKNKVCSVTQQVEEEIYGYAYPFNYATPDKPGQIAGFFNKQKFWRNYPISKDAAILLEQGAKFLEENLSGFFYGYKYFIVPNPVLNISLEKYDKIVRLLAKALAEEKQSSKKSHYEELAMKAIAREKNYFTVDLLFYETAQSAFRIIKFIEEILPSRFHKLFIDVADSVNRMSIFQNAFKEKNEIKALEFNFGIFKETFGDKFLDIVHKAFVGEPVDRSFMFERAMNLYRKKYTDAVKNNRSFLGIYPFKTSFMAFYYLTFLGLINFNQNYQYMETLQTTEKKSFDFEAFNNFVKEHKEFFDADVKIGLFALGVLVRYILDIQNASLGSTPFLGKLRGFHLNPELVQNIYTEALAKLQQYQNFYAYGELRDIIAKYLTLNTNQLKSLSNNEISYYFVAGMELGRQFKLSSENEKEEN